MSTNSGRRSGDDLFVIRSGLKAPLEEVREVLRNRDLLAFLVISDIKVRYAQSVMGLGWALVRPIFSVLVFTLIFGRLAKLPSDGLPYAVFSFAAMVPWMYFSSTTQGATASLINQRNVLAKIYYPRLFIPAVPIISGLLDLIIGTLVFIPLAWGIWGLAPGLPLLAVPLAILIMLMTSYGLGLWLSALAVQFRDVAYFSSYSMQALMYLAPVVWSLSMLTALFPGQEGLVRALYGLFPMVGVIETFRAGVNPDGVVPWDLLASGAAGAVLLLGSGLAFFRRREPLFADVA